MLILSTPWEGKRPDFGKFKVKHVEYRLDYFPDPLQINYSSFTKHDILCYKSDHDELLVLDKMLSSKAIVDVDIDLLKRQNLAISSRMIVSTHLSGFDEGKITEFLTVNGNPFAFKLVFPARSFQEILDTAELIKASGKTNVIFNVTGKWGIFQRSMYQVFSSMAAYTCWDDPTEPSQPEYVLLDHTTTFIYEKVNHFCGIIGGEHVPDSSSYLSYNSFMLLKMLKATFLPIPCNDASEAIQVLHWLLPRYYSMAFAVTNPFKSAMAKAVKSQLSVINTLVFNSRRIVGSYYNSDFDTFVLTNNTDVMALEDIIAGFFLPYDAPIMIYGTGDCADAFCRKLIRLGYQNIFLKGRNQDKVASLCQKYKLKCENPKEVELLINASDLGKNHNDDISFLPQFSYLIDLPYTVGEQTLLAELGDEDSEFCVPGKHFFAEQFMHQMKIIIPDDEFEDQEDDEES